jgi:isopentenyl-diphosphate Delta-isomerase
LYPEFGSLPIRPAGNTQQKDDTHMNTMIPAWRDGTLTPVEKLETHLQGLRHKAVSVFVLRGDDILIQQRALGKYHTPGLWANTCCTHPDWDEDTAVCAGRRLNQELGITGLTPIFRQQLEYRARVSAQMIEHEVVDVFVAHTGPDLSLSVNPDEVMATRWLTLDALRREMAQTPERFTPWLHIYLKDHARTILGAQNG